MSESKKYYVVQAIADGCRFFVGDGEKPDAVKVTVRIVEGTGIGEEHETFLQLGPLERTLEYSMKSLRALGWTSNDVTTLEGIGSTKAKMQVKKRPRTETAGFFTNYNFFELKEPPPQESLREFAKKYQEVAKTAEKVSVNQYNMADKTLPPAVEPTTQTDDGLLF